MIVWIAREVGGSLFAMHKRFGTSDEFRAALKEVNGLSVALDGDDGTTNSVVYLSDPKTTVWTGINVGDKLPDDAIENGIVDNLISKLGIENVVFAWDVESDSDEFADKAKELTARVDDLGLQRPQ